MTITKSLLITALSFAMLTTISAATKDTRCYELRTYHVAPGKMEALHKRFREHTLALFKKHGITSIGYWERLDKEGKPENKLTFLLSYPTREAREASWKAFGADPDWQAAYKASEANGPLVTKVENPYLTATDYSPAIMASGSGEPRAFELRIYKCEPGRLSHLNARFRDHTVGLFSKHGMTNFGYWTPMDKAQGAEDTLIYILAHKSREAAAASFKAFRDDPDWVAARKASEAKAGGSLTAKDGVQSIFMKPTDYSPTK
jgi:NIPSNAP